MYQYQEKLFPSNTFRKCLCHKIISRNPLNWHNLQISQKKKKTHPTVLAVHFGENQFNLSPPGGSTSEAKTSATAVPVRLLLLLFLQVRTAAIRSFSYWLAPLKFCSPASVSMIVHPPESAKRSRLGRFHPSISHCPAAWSVQHDWRGSDRPTVSGRGTNRWWLWQM